MPDPQLQQYLKDQLQLGYTRQQLIPVLKQSGWPEDQIDSAFTSLQNPSPAASLTVPSPAAPQNPSPSTSPTSPRKKLLFPIIGVILLLIFAGSGTWAYFNLWLSPERILFQTLTNHLQVKTFSYQGEVVSTIKVNNPNLLSQVITQTKILGEATGPLALGVDLPPESSAQTLIYPQLPGNFTFGIQFQGKTNQSSAKWQSHQTEFSTEIVSQGLENYLNQTGNLGLDIKSSGSTIYLRVRNLLGFGFFNFQEIDNRWIKIDSQMLTDAFGVDIEAEIEKQFEIRQKVNMQYLELFKQYPIIQVADKLPGEQIDNVDTYHYRFVFNEQNLAAYLTEIYKIMALEIPETENRSITQQQIDQLAQQLRELNLPSGEIWIGKPDKLIRKIEIAMDIAEIAGQTNDQYSGNITFKINFSNYGQSQEIAYPDQFFTWNEVMQKFQSGSLYNSDVLIQQMGSPRDSQRRSDLYAITNAVNQYAVENNGNLPPTITSIPIDIGTSGANLEQYLVPVYIIQIPYDPQTGTPEITGYLISKDEQGRILATASGEETPLIQVTR